MLYRLFVTGVVLMWLTAMAALFAHDIWPVWTAQDPPPMTAEKLADVDQTTEQFRIIDKQGKRLGTGWRDVSAKDERTMVEGWMYLEAMRGLPAIRIRSSRDFDSEGLLESFQMDVLDIPGLTIRANGERSGPYIACQFQAGHLRRTTRLDASASRMIGESMNPFSVLPELKVGQRWRMQVLDPLTAAMQSRVNFRAVIAEVVGTEMIASPLDGSDVECFVVQLSSQRAKAWVTSGGQVLRQEVSMPLLGKVSVEAEPFDEKTYDLMRRGGGKRESREKAGSAVQ